ncbi:CBS domain-containing protein [Calidifontibacillus erzurumensis]|uniref:CBS domain-containing protein n=1 Tax=Calidifontibacillus erzurumensis TaxID=2741433 RepID=A0A8J8GFF0_9BACI|nr:CBS domain-containing protein [Calidifontibacillus erzurumensis]NSL52652.1 CBS domain-containing protein [Calidifontibacillus erzurumensis]
MNSTKKEDYTKSERFLAAFNIISSEIEKMVEARGHIPFYRLVDMAKKKNGLIMTYKDDLKELSELRNAIVHGRHFPAYTIAEPHLSVVELAEKIAEELTKPKTIIPFFECEVKTFQKTDHLREVLKVIKQHGYSQFPVYDQDRFVGLLTNQGITMWIAQNFDKNSMGNCLDAYLSDVLSFEKIKKNYIFMSKNKNIYDVREKFLNHFDLYATRLEAVLITENGRPDEKLLGLATPFDMVRIPFLT